MNVSGTTWDTVGCDGNKMEKYGEPVRTCTDRLFLLHYHCDWSYSALTYPSTMVDL